MQGRGYSIRGLYLLGRREDCMQEKPPTRRRLTRRGKVVLSIALVLILLLAGILYSQRHQIHQMVRNLTLPPAQAVQITPLTLTATDTTAPGQTNSGDWT